MPVINALLNAKINIQMGISGWSETYPLKATDAQAGVVVLDELMLRRAAWLSTDACISFGRVHFAGAPRDACATTHTLPIKAIKLAQLDNTDGGNAEDPFTAVHMRLETANCRWTNRLFRGIPDILISNGQFKGDEDALVATPIGQALPLPLGAASLKAKRKAFWAFLRDNTYHARDLGTTPKTWDANDYTRIMFRRIGKRDTGRPFGQFRGRGPKRPAAA